MNGLRFVGIDFYFFAGKRVKIDGKQHARAAFQIIGNEFAATERAHFACSEERKLDGKIQSRSLFLESSRKIE